MAAEEVKPLTAEEMEALEADERKSRPLTAEEMEELEAEDAMANAPTGDAAEQLLTSAEQAANVVSAGYLPQIVGGVKAIAGDDYVQSRDEYIKEMEARADENPISAAVGTGAGIVGSVALPGGLVAKGLSKIPKIGNVLRGSKVARGLVGAGSGAGAVLAQNPGEVEGEIDPLQLETRLEMMQESPISSAISVGLGAIAPGVQSSKAIESEKRSSAYRAIAPKMKVAAKSVDQELISGPASFSKIGKFAAEKGYVDKNKFNVYQKAAKNLDDIGKKIGDEVEKVDIGYENWSAAMLADEDVHNGWIKYIENKAITPENLKEKILPEIRKNLIGFSGRDSILGTINEIVDSYLEGGRGLLSFGDLQGMRQRVDDQINWFDPNVKGKNKALMMLREKISEAQDGFLDMIQEKDKTLGKALKPLRAEYQRTKIIADATRDQIAKEIRRLPQKLTFPIMATAAGAGIGFSTGSAGLGTLLGAALGLGSEAIEHFRQPVPRFNLMQRLQDPSSRIYSSPQRLAGAEARTSAPRLLEGYPETQLIDVMPEEILMAEDLINKDARLSIVERARQLRLLRKYNKMVGEVPLMEQ